MVKTILFVPYLRFPLGAGCVRGGMRECESMVLGSYACARNKRWGLRGVREEEKGLRD